MPTSAKVKLGRDQVLLLDGTVLEGVREVDVEIDARTVDLTSWSAQYSSTMPVCMDATIRLLIYWRENWALLADKFKPGGPYPVILAISNACAIKCVPTGVKVMQPIHGVLAWEVTLRPYNFE